MKTEYKVNSFVIDSTEDEKEEVYEKLANIFVRMAQKELEENKK